MDLIGAHVSEGRFVYVASLDIYGAFDTAPHEELVATMRRMGMDWFIARFLEKWLTRRGFRVRLITTKGRFLSRPRDISRGLPQGGVISPFLWIMHFDRFFELIGPLAGKAGELLPGLGGQSLCLVYADDVPFAIAHRLADGLGRLAEGETLEFGGRCAVCGWH